MTHLDYLVVGAGAIGSIIAAHLAKDGHSVAVLARGERVNDIQKNGLRIRGLVSFDAPVTVLVDAEEVGSLRSLIIATKTPGTEALLCKLGHLRPELVFSIQNGLMKNELLASTFGPERVLGALANTSGELLPSGEVNFTRNVNILLGELSGQCSERLTSLVEHLQHAGVRSASVDNIVSLEWSKFISWVPLMLLSITTRKETWQYLSNEHCARLIYRLVREVATLVRVQGLEIVDDGTLLPVNLILEEDEDTAVDAVLASGERFRLNSPDHRMSSLQDMLAGRGLEVHETLGYAVSKAKQFNLEAPLLRASYQLAAAIDDLL